MAHREIIRSNMSKLCDGTRLNSRLLNDCLQQDIIVADEYDEINSLIGKSNGYDTKSKFYSLFRRKSSEKYERFVSLTEEGENKQDDTVVQILKRGLKVPGISFEEDGWFECREPVTTFCGRTTELKQLHAHMILDLNELTTTKFSRTTVLCGLGGVGKSELARKYAYEHSHFYDNNVFWINAETRGSLTDSFRNYARCKMDIAVNDVHGGEKDIGHIVREVYSSFHGRKCLFIFDNAENFKSSVDPNDDEGTGHYFPQILPYGTRPYVLVTSRYSEWVDKIAVLPLGPLKTPEAVELVHKVKEMATEEEERVYKLVDTLGYLPLALQQAMAYITRIALLEERIGSGKTFGIAEYLQLYSENAEEPLNYNYSKDTEHHYIYPTLICWEMTLKRIKDEQYGMEALQILSCMAYLRPYSIPIAMFSHLIEGQASDFEDKLALSAAVGFLAQYSMVVNVGGVLSVHRLVQDVIQLKLKKTGEEPNILAIALCTILKTMIKLSDESKLDQRCIISMQALSVWNHAEPYKNLILKFSHFPIHLCKRLTAYGRYNESAVFCEQATHSLLQVLHESNPAIIDLKFETANALMEQEQHKKALPLFQAVYEQRRDNVVPDIQESVPRVMRKIAYIHYKQGNYLLALEQCDQILKMGNLRNEDDVMETLYYKSRILMTIGSLVQSSQILENLYEYQKKQVGTDNRNTLECGHYLAVCLRKQGKLTSSSAILDAVIDGRTGTLSGSHPLTLSSRVQRGVNQYYQEDYENASTTLECCLAEVENASGMGKDHPTYFMIRTYIALILRKKGKLQAGLDNFTDILHQAKMLERFKAKRSFKSRATNCNNPLGIRELRRSQNQA